MYRGANMKSVLFSAFCAAFLSLSSIAAPVQFASNGNYYDFIAGASDYDAAKAAASSLTFNGVQGHLATITSQAENDFLKDNFGNSFSQYFAWLGGTDRVAENDWLWDAGPETGIQFSNGQTPTPPFNFANWNAIEPDNFALNQHFAVYLLGSLTGWSQGQWGDVALGGSGVVQGYLVEYEIAIVPIPATVWLFGSGLLGLFGITRKKAA